MRSGRVDYVPEALLEAEEALGWYVERSLRAGEAFYRELERALKLIAGSPHVWPRFEAGTRRYLLRKFPFSIIYRETEAGIEVVAVAHHKRRPRYWHGR